MSEVNLLTYPQAPWEHQKQGIEKALATRDFAFFFEAGTGKTATTIHTLRHQYRRHKRLLKTIIICPVNVCINWKREFEKNSKIGHQVFVLSGSQVLRRDTFSKAITLNKPPIIVMNYESLQMKGLMQDILSWCPEIVVFDESHRLKNPQAVRTKMSILLADRAAHRYILSGTPILNSLQDIWAQYRILDKGESFQNSLGEPLNFYAFRSRYFVDKNSGMPSHSHFPKWVPNENAFSELQQIIYKKAMRVVKSECLDLPPFVKVQIPVTMGVEQKRLYNEMRDEFLTFLQSGEAVTAQIAITKSLRLQQIASGFAKTEDGVEITLKDNPRITALSELLEDLLDNPTAKVIVWCVFTENYEQVRRVCDKLAVEYTEIHGGVSAKNRQPNIDKFQKELACRVMIANPAAAGEGVNLTAAAYTIVYSRDFSLGHDLQLEARNYRGGSEIHEKITRYDLVANDTIDEIILQALNDKLSAAEAVLVMKQKLKKK